MPTRFACPGCNNCSLRNCIKCFDEKISLINNKKGRRALIEWQAQLITIFAPDNFASTIISLGLVELLNGHAVNFYHLRRQILAMDEFYQTGIPKPSAPQVIESPAFRLRRIPTPDELWVHFQEVEGPKFFREEEVPTIWFEVESEENRDYTERNYHRILNGQNPDDLWLYMNYRDTGALTDLTLRPHNNGSFELNDHALCKFSPATV